MFGRDKINLCNVFILWIWSGFIYVCKTVRFQIDVGRKRRGTRPLWRLADFISVVIITGSFKFFSENFIHTHFTVLKVISFKFCLTKRIGPQNLPLFREPSFTLREICHQNKFWYITKYWILTNFSTANTGCVSHFVRQARRRCMYLSVLCLTSHVSNIFETWDGQVHTTAVSSLSYVLRLTKWETDPYSWGTT